MPTASVNVLAATSIVVAPLADGVKVAVYTVLDAAAKLLNAPLVTVISPTAKSVVASLLVKVRESVASLVVEPSAPSAAVMVMVGAVPSGVAIISSVRSLSPPAPVDDTL